MPLVSGPINFSKPVDRLTLNGRSALVTGGASGIGAGTVRALAENGAYVTIADTNVAAGTAYASSLSVEGYQVQFIETDVTEWSSQVQAFKSAQAFSPSGTINIVIACAGIAGAPMIQSDPFLSKSDDPRPPAVQLAIINVNLVGSMFTATLAAHYWRLQEAKASFSTDNVLIFVASNIAYFPSPGFTGYTASKMGVRGLWKSMRSDPNFVNVCRTNLMAPHIVRTPMTKGLQQMLEPKDALMVNPEDCVECLLRLCCDTDIKGRAIGVHPEKDWFDLFDDLDDFDGAKAFKEHYSPQVQAVFDFVDPSKSMS